MDGLIRLPHVNFRTASIGALCCLGSLTNWANDAELTIACQSIAVYPATADDAVGSTYEGSFTSDFSDDGELISINHEWFPVGGTVGYASGLQLVDTLFEVTYLAIVEADIPLRFDRLRGWTGARGGVVVSSSRTNPGHPAPELCVAVAHRGWSEL
jgi:hypothetical protein